MFDLSEMKLKSLFFKAFVCLSVISMISALVVISWGIASLISKGEAVIIAKDKLVQDYPDLELWNLDITTSNWLFDFKNMDVYYQVRFIGTKIEVVDYVTVYYADLPVSTGNSETNMIVRFLPPYPKHFDKYGFENLNYNVIVDDMERVNIRFSFKGFEKLYEINARTGEIEEIVRRNEK